MSNRNDSRLLQWLHTGRVYILIFTVVLAGGALYFSLQSPTRSMRESPQVNASPGISAPQNTKDPYDSIKQEVLAYYRSKYNDNDPRMTAEVVSYGCHVEVHIVKGGKAVKSFAYFGQGQFYEQTW
ncbi:MAG TPA: hypothetical protein GX506_03950 [Firmicutes bacterium]|nr:hypothetical protein [Bacillota bacterium]